MLSLKGAAIAFLWRGQSVQLAVDMQGPYTSSISIENLGEPYDDSTLLTVHSARTLEVTSAYEYVVYCIRVRYININVTWGHKSPGWAIFLVRFRLVMKMPTSARIATKCAPFEWKVVEQTPKRWLQQDPNDVETVDRKSHQRDAHGRGSPVIDLHRSKAPGKVSESET